MQGWSEGGGERPSVEKDPQNSDRRKMEKGCQAAERLEEEMQHKEGGLSARQKRSNRLKGERGWDQRSGGPTKHRGVKAR